MEPFSKDGFNFSKIKTNNYHLHFSLQNDNIIISKIVDFNLIKLIYDLNGDIYEYVNLEQINENEANMIVLMKPLFQDLGLPQRFSHVKMLKSVEKNNITFKSRSINVKPSNIPDDSIQLPIENMECLCNIINDHKMEFFFNIQFSDNFKIVAFVEKMVGMILFKMFNRMKGFVESVK